MAWFYSNENFPQQVVEEWRGLGHDVLTVQDAGQANQAISDDEVLAFAVAADRAVVTINRKHFIRLHRERPDHAGIIVCTFDSDFIGQAQRIHAAVEAQADLHGQLLRVNRPA